MYRAHIWHFFKQTIKLNFYLLFCIQFFSTPLFSQNLTSSPYSYFGIGDLQYFGSAAFGNMGQVNQGIRRPYDINILNPASYSALKQTNIEAGAMLNNGTLINGANKIDVSLSGLTYFNIGTNIYKKGIGLVFGASPMSSIGFTSSNFKTIETDTVKNILAKTSQVGDGGLNKAFIGVGAKLNKYVSVGFNMNYIFGQNNSSIVQSVPAQYYLFNWTAERKDYISGFVFDYGIQTHIDSIVLKIPQYKLVIDSNGFERKKWVMTNKKPISINGGLTFNLQTNVNSIRNYSFRTLTRGGIDYSRDSILTNSEKNGNIVFPMSLNYGISITNNENWTIASDFGTTAWSKFSSFEVNTGLQDAWHFNIGASWLPDVKEDTRNYLKRLEYRLGYRIEQTSAFINNQSVNINAYSFGIGIPIAERDKYRKYSRVNVGFEYATRGANTSLVNEEYFKFTVGLVFTDRWFIKYKYD